MSKMTEKQKKEVKKFLDKMDWEGGAYEYFVGYTSTESAQKSVPFLPKEFFETAKLMADSAQKLENMIEDLREEVGDED